MRLRFDPNQAHQRAALSAILGCFPPPSRRFPERSVAVIDAIAVAANHLESSAEQLDEAARRVQQAAGLPATGWDRIGEPEAGQGIPAISIEMETGTGKTYLFLRSALELARHHGLRKFVIVVPSVAIREGVRKTLQITREHFGGLYPDVPYRFSVYDGARPHVLDRFVRSSTVELMIITIDAFNKQSNVLRQPSDRFLGRAPIDLVRAVGPVLLLDEPHHLHSPLRIAALCDLHPCLALRFGATYRSHRGLVHRLSPADAHRQRLVKTIEVVDGLPEGDSDAAVSARIRATLETHLRRQAELRPQGIKVLSLFFVDRVGGYTDENGRVRRIFDAHYRDLASLDPHGPRLPPERVRAAYFAQRRQRPVDSKTGRSAADEEAYVLIMRNKEQLLDLSEPVSFVFTHSALREGWDNPNVFQICTLSATRSDIKKRQEIGRGIRLCVDQQGSRVRDPDINVLRVFAHESYEAYVRRLQDELAETFAPTELPPLPRRVDPGSRPRADDVSLEEREPSWDLAAMLRSAPAELASRLRFIGPGAPCRTLVDRVAGALRDRSPPLPLRRATILDVLDQAAQRGASLADTPAVLAAFLAAMSDPMSPEQLVTDDGSID